MAGGKETPRQKMIGMMYLVLTALLALNVAKEVLNAFVVMNDSLEATNQQLELKNVKTYDLLQAQAVQNPMKAKKWFDRATIVREESKSLFNFIQNVKAQVMMETEGLPEEEVILGTGEDGFIRLMELGAVDAKDNYDAPTYTLGLADPSQAVSMSHGYDVATLKQKLNKYREQMLELIPEDQRDIPAYRSIIETFTLKDTVESGEKVTWEAYQFYHAPLASVIANLTRIQTDVRNAEADLIAYFYTAVDGETFKFTHLSPAVVAPSNYIMLGDTFKADVFLAAFDSTRNPQITFAPGYTENAEGDFVFGSDTLRNDQLRIDDGMGALRVVANREGLQTLKGRIKVLNPDKKSYSEYPVETSYMVARPSMTVSATAMNVFYKGLDNPVSVSVPGVPKENIRVSLSGGGSITKASGGGYTVKVANNAGRTVRVNVSAAMANGQTQNMGSMEFRVKNLPMPIATINGKTSGTIKLSDLKVVQGVRLSYGPDFMFDLPIECKGLTFSAQSGSVIIPDTRISSNRFNQEIKTKINAMRRGGKVIISEIRAKDASGRTFKIDTNIVLTIIN